ncbi:MAG: thiol-disulfide isomerase/thioredoxin [Paracoccaceae bacterium]|jgi:thiol-disulfide isomerase/thioredoxin
MKTIARMAAATALLLVAIPASAADPVTPDATKLDAARIAHIAGLKQLDGRKVDADRLRGRPVIVSFFASWCPPCNAEFEHMKLLHLAHAADGLEVVAINLFEGFAGFDDEGKRLKRFLGRHTPVFPVVTGNAETAKLFGDVKRIPTVYVFDRRGNSRLHFVHAEGSQKTNPGLSDLRRAVRDSLGIGAAGRSPSLRKWAISATNPQHSRHFAESAR